MLSAVEAQFWQQRSSTALRLTGFPISLFLFSATFQANYCLQPVIVQQSNYSRMSS